jgi:DNA topoisomerase IA
VPSHPAWDTGINFRIKPKRVKKEGWVNVYPDKYAWHITAKTEFHFNKEHADRMATKDRVACIRIEWEEEE